MTDARTCPPSKLPTALLRDADATRGRPSSGRRSTRTPPRASATPRARPATRRARCTRTAPPCCTASRCAARRLRPVGARRRPARRADVPRQRLGHPVRRARWPARSSCCPGRKLDGASLFELIESEKVTCSRGRADGLARAARAPEKNGLSSPRCERVVVGGAAAPPAMIRAFRERTASRCCMPGA